MLYAWEYRSDHRGNAADAAIQALKFSFVMPTIIAAITAETPRAQRYKAMQSVSVLFRHAQYQTVRARFRREKDVKKEMISLKSEIAAMKTKLRQ